LWLLHCLPLQLNRSRRPISGLLFSQLGLHGTKAMVERNAEALGHLVTPDFQSIGGTGINSGMTTEKAGYEALFKSRPDLFYERKPVHVEKPESRDYAFEEGTWAERWTEADGPTELQGNYFVMWRLINGEWKQQADIFVPSRCIEKNYCAPREPLKISAVSKTLVSAYAGWYQLRHQPTDWALVDVPVLEGLNH
jgi:Domain of unknown function (DUF4440)